MKKILIVLAATAMVACNSTGKSGSGNSTSTDTSSKKSATADAEKKSDAESSSVWKYESDTDKMTSKLKYFASVNSTNKLNFASPYEGGSTATVTLRGQDGKNEVILTIDKGQFICHETDGCPVKVRFDKDAAISFSGGEPTDGGSTTLFIDPGSKFIKHIKKAKKMIVQAEFYQEGVRDMEFNVDGLKWDH